MTERRSLWILGVVLIGQLLALGAQVPAATGNGSLLEASLLRLVGPLAHLVDSSGDLVSGMGEGLRLRRRLLAENERLRAEILDLERERVRLLGVEGELERLSRALDYVPPEPIDYQVADIVYIDHASWLQTIFLFVGGMEVAPNQAVVSSDGLVGRLVVASPPYAKVQLVTDRAASVGAMIERTRRQGVVRGAESGMLEMHFVPLQEDVRIGDRVLSAGIDGVFPRGLPVGTVTAVEPGSDLFHRILLRPAVDFGELDQVLVLAREPIPEDLREEAADARP